MSTTPSAATAREASNPPSATGIGQSKTLESRLLLPADPSDTPGRVLTLKQSK